MGRDGRRITPESMSNTMIGIGIACFIGSFVLFMEDFILPALGLLLVGLGIFVNGGMGYLQYKKALTQEDIFPATVLSKCGGVLSGIGFCVFQTLDAELPCAFIGGILIVFFMVSLGTSFYRHARDKKQYWEEFGRPQSRKRKRDPLLVKLEGMEDTVDVDERIKRLKIMLEQDFISGQEYEILKLKLLEEANQCQ